MAAKEFINYYEKSEIISLEDFFKKEFFVCSTPKKSKINLSQPINNIIFQIRNEIFYNLKLNQCFLKNASQLNKATLRPFYKLIKATESTFDENQKIQLILLLHLSKSNVKLDILKLFFGYIQSVNLIGDMTMFKFADHSDVLFSKISSNKIIRENINHVIYQITGKTSLKDCCIVKNFFKTDIPGLAGFCGINEVYLNANMLNYMFAEKIFSKYSEDEKMKIFDLNFTSLVVHEMAHVVLRSTMDDINVSSPIISKEKNKSDKPDSIEAGILAEKQLFKASINWRMSAQMLDFDLEYYSSMLEKLFDGEMIDLKLNGLSTFEGQYLLMVVYFVMEDQIRCF